jgi:hypothetical protein
MSVRLSWADHARPVEHVALDPPRNCSSCRWLLVAEHAGFAATTRSCLPGRAGKNKPVSALVWWPAAFERPRDVNRFAELGAVASDVLGLGAEPAHRSRARGAASPSTARNVSTHSVPVWSVTTRSAACGAACGSMLLRIRRLEPFGQHRLTGHRCHTQPAVCPRSQ